MKTISSQTTLLCLTFICAYQPIVQAVASATATTQSHDNKKPLINIHQKVTTLHEETQARLKEASLSQMHLDPANFHTRVQQIIDVKKHLATALSFNQPTNIHAIMDSFISLEQILSAAQTALKIYYQDNVLQSNIHFLQQLQHSIKVASQTPSMNPNQLQEAFYSLSFIKKLITQEIFNKKLLIDETTHSTRPLNTNQDFKHAIQILQHDATTRAIRPDSINWDNIEIVFDALVKIEQSTASASQTDTQQTTQQNHGWFAWLRARIM